MKKKTEKATPPPKTIQLARSDVCCLLADLDAQCVGRRTHANGKVDCVPRPIEEWRECPNDVLDKALENCVRVADTLARDVQLNDETTRTFRAIMKAHRSRQGLALEPLVVVVDEWSTLARGLHKRDNSITRKTACDLAKVFGSGIDSRMTNRQAIARIKKLVASHSVGEITKHFGNDATHHCRLFNAYDLVHECMEKRRRVGVVG